jgi:hypothetical protein
VFHLRTLVFERASARARLAAFSRETDLTELRLTLLLGPRETIEAAELAMPDLPHVLAAAFPLDGWDADEVERLLMLAGGSFREAIMARKHEEPPPPPKPVTGPSPQIEAWLRAPIVPPEVEQAWRTQETFAVPASAAMQGLRIGPGTIEPAPPLPTLVRDVWGDPTPAERLAIEAAPPPLSFRVEIARTLAPEAWVEADASLKKADEVLAVVERRRVA